MNLLIEFTCQNNIELPIQYNNIVQGFIYKTLDEKMADFLHNKGYGKDRKFKLFCFSNLYGRRRHIIKDDTVQFGKRITLEISSPVDDFCESFANGLFRNVIQLGRNTLEVEGIKIFKQIITGRKAIFDTLSPVVAYSTLLRPDKSKYTCYFQPGEEDFRRITEANLRKKYEAFTGKTAPSGQISIRTISHPKMHVMNYKGTVITTRLEITGPEELLQTAADSGLGSKNSQGFGYMRLLRME